MDLNGILSAHHLGIGAVLAFKKRKLLLATARAIGDSVQLDLANITEPKIENRKYAWTFGSILVFSFDEPLHGQKGLPTGDDSDGRSDDPYGVA